MAKSMATRKVLYGFEPRPNIDIARAPDAAGNIWPWVCGHAHKIDTVPLL